LRGRPPGNDLGISGSSRVHSASRRSLGQALSTSSLGSGRSLPLTRHVALDRKPQTLLAFVHLVYPSSVRARSSMVSRR